MIADDGAREFGQKERARSTIIDYYAPLERFSPWVSKMICVYFGFELLRLVIGLKISH